MSEISVTEREQAALACWWQRADARRERFQLASACCPDCADASRSDPLDQARHHRRQAERLAAEAVQTAGASARVLLAARRTNLVSVTIIAVLALILLAVTVAGLADG